MLRIHLRGSPRTKKDKEIKIMRLIEIKNQLKNSNIKLIDFLEEQNRTKNNKLMKKETENMFS